MDYTKQVKQLAIEKGANLFGIADLNYFRGKLPVIPENLLNSFKYGVSFAIKLNYEIIEHVKDKPTPEYANHYLEVNGLLNKISGEIVKWIQDQEYKAVNILASELKDEDRLMGSISHKAVARMAGIGWQGKSLLIINPEIGPRLRLATILTDMPLTSDTPLPNQCDKCKACVVFCPAKAIKNVSTDSNYESTEIAVDLHKCDEKLYEFARLSGVGVRICGVCVKVCPYGMKSNK